MNQGNFPNMSGQPMPMQAGPQPAPPPTQNIQQFIFRTLSQQSVPQGWQASVPTQLRTNIVFQIFSQLRLLQTRFDTNYALNLALSFEAKALADSADKHMYEQQCKSKMEDIHGMRTKQSAGMQQQVNQQMNMPHHLQNMGQGIAQNQAQGPPQFQQGPPNPQQQHMMHLQGMPMQQQLQQPSHQQHNMPMGPHAGAMQQAQPTMSQQMPQQPHPNAPTAQENQLIIQLANQLHAQTPPQRLQAIQDNMRQMNAELREQVVRSGLDPMTYFFRNQAMKKFVEMKRSQAGAQGGVAPQPAAMMNGMSRAPQVRPMAQQGPGPQQNLEPPFDQIIGQQQDGLRSQEAGQVVVPASNAQAISERNAARANAQKQMNLQNGGNRMQPANTNPQSQSFWNPQQGQGNVKPGPGPSAANPPNANQAPSNVLQGQPGGLDNQITRTPSQTPGMPNLNKAAPPPGQAPNIWSQRTPQMAQAKPHGTPVPQQTTQQPTEQSKPPQQRPPIMQNMPLQMQQHLASLPEEQRRGFLLNLQKRHLANQQQELQRQQLQHQSMAQSAKVDNARAANARAVMDESFPMSHQTSQPGLQTGPTAAMSSQNMAVPQAMMQKVQPGFPPNPSAFGARQQPGQGQQPPQQRGTPQHPGPNVNPPPPLTKDQVQQMDQRLFPAEILKGGMAGMSPEVKTWGQLKEYAMKNAARLPPGIIPKLEHLQAMNYQAVQQGLGPAPARPGGPPATSAQPQAPYAQMVSQPNAQAPVAAPRLPPGMNIPQPTPQEMQAWRTKLPPELQHISDDQLRQFIMRQKADAIAKNMQQPKNNQMGSGLPQGHQGIPNQNQGPNGLPDANQVPPPSHAKPTTQQNQKGANIATKQGQSSRNAPVAKQAQKGVKRPSNDDVVEVPNPNLAISQNGAKQNPQTHGEKTQAHVKPSVNQNASSQSQNAASQPTRPPGIPNLSKEEVERRDARLRQLMTEVGQNQPLRRPIPMSPQVHAEMSQKLREMSQMMGRMEASLPTFFRNNPNEKLARQLIETRLKVKAQYRDQNFNLMDQFTISSKELESAYNNIKQYFAYVMSTFVKRNNNASQSVEQQQNQQQVQKPAVTQEKAPLSAANLREQQNMLQAQRQAGLQKQQSGHGSRVPAAPTSDKPPFPLGPQSPHGASTAFGPPTLTAAQLVLPQNKRRKSNHPPSAGSTPHAVQEPSVAKSSPLAAKLPSPEGQRATVPQMSFRCGFSHCLAGQRGFANQAELEQHNEEEHEPKDPVIEDPAEFALESMRIALGLDDDGKAKPRKENLEAPKMKTSLSAQSEKAIKPEAGTPMARASTQTGPSPASNLLRTPQPIPGVKTPVSDSRSTVQEGKSRIGKGTATSPKEAPPPAVDPWAGSLVSADAITSAWSGLADMQPLSFSKIQMGLTPSSDLSSSNDKSEKNSPRPSDISENDAVKIHIDVDQEERDHWIPSEWLEDSPYGDIASLNFGHDSNFGQARLDGDDMDWDIFGDLADAVMLDDGSAVASGGKGKKRSEETASDEWLKVYAPGKMANKGGG